MRRNYLPLRIISQSENSELSSRNDACQPTKYTGGDTEERKKGVAVTTQSANGMVTRWSRHESRCPPHMEDFDRAERFYLVGMTKVCFLRLLRFIGTKRDSGMNIKYWKSDLRELFIRSYYKQDVSSAFLCFFWDNETAVEIRFIATLSVSRWWNVSLSFE